MNTTLETKFVAANSAEILNVLTGVLLDYKVGDLVVLQETPEVGKIVLVDYKIMRRSVDMISLQGKVTRTYELRKEN